MFPPFPQEKAEIVLQKIYSLLLKDEIHLIRDALPSDNRENSLVMLGCLVCHKKEDSSQTVNLVTVSGISCHLENLSENELFVEPVVPAKKINEALSKNDKKIHELTDEILILEKNIDSKNEEIGAIQKSKIKELKKERDLLCKESLIKVFDEYEFSLWNKDRKKMLQILAEKQHLSKIEKIKLPPTGTGDCCAPKLLSYAFKNDLVPLSLAETKLQFVMKENKCILKENFCNIKIKENPELELFSPCKARCDLILPEILGLDILYRDDDIIVVNKQSGVLSVPGKTLKDSIVNRVKNLFPFCIEQPAVHRLDMETSGLMVLAFKKDAHRILNKQFEDRRVQKKYVALLDGVLAKKGIKESGVMELFFRLDIDNRPRQIWDEVYGKSSITEWKILNVEKYSFNEEKKRDVTRVEFTPHTGRTHQLRVASADNHGFGIPIIGDYLYGKREEGQRLYLHATDLSFFHPITNEKMIFHCEADF